MSDKKREIVLKLTPDQENYRKKINELIEKIHEYKVRKTILESQCHHAFAKDGLGSGVWVYCLICGYHPGWYCPSNDNPEVYCKYTDDFDSCDYCGHPEERK